MSRIFVILFLLSSVCFGDDNLQQQKFEKQIKLYNNLENNSKNLRDISFYKNRLFKNEEIINLDETSNEKLNLFIVYKAQSLSDIMSMVQASWDVERSKIKDEEDKKYFYNLCYKLFELRKQHALEFEKIVLEKISKIENLSEQEKKDFINKIQKWNEEQNLIKRNLEND